MPLFFQLLFVSLLFANCEEVELTSSGDLFTIDSDDSCTPCYQIEGSSAGLQSPWLSQSEMALKSLSLGKRGPIGVLHPGLDLKTVLKKEPKEVPAPPKPEPESQPSPDTPDSPNTPDSPKSPESPAAPKSVKVPPSKAVKDNSTATVVVTKKKPMPKEVLVDLNITVPSGKKPPLEVEKFIIGKKKPDQNKDIFKQAPQTCEIRGKPDDCRPPLVVKKIIGPGGPAGGKSGPSKINETMSYFDLTMDYEDSSVKMYGAEGSWWRSDGMGTYFELSEVYNNDVLYSGTLCPNSDSEGDSCGMQLSEGYYVFHVYGTEDPNKNSVAWNFCGIDGGAESDLLIYINSNGDCSPMSLKVAPESVSNARNFVVMKGSMELTGWYTESLNEYDARVLMSSMLYESRQLMTTASSDSFKDWVRSIVVSSMHETYRDEYAVSNQVDFFMAMIPGDFGVYDVTADTKSFMLDVMSATIESSIQSSEFIYNMYNVDKYSSYDLSDNLAYTTAVKLVSLELLGSQKDEATATNLFSREYGLFIKESLEEEVGALSQLYGEMSQSNVVAGVVAVALLAGISFFVVQRKLVPEATAEDSEAVAPLKKSIQNIHTSMGVMI